MRLALVLVLVASIAVAPQRAEAQRSYVFHADERRSQLDGETVAMHLVYSAAALTGAWAFIAGSIHIVDAGAPACVHECAGHLDEAAVAYSGFASIGIGALLMFIGIGIQSDVRARRRGMGWGDLGLSISF